MKRYFTLLLALLLSFGAFAEDEGEWLYSEDENAEYTEEASEEFEEMDWRDSIFFEAMDIYRWFTSMPLDVDEEIPDDAGERYLVLDERYNTYDGLKEQVAAYFSDGITESLMENGMYVEYDGMLYTDGKPLETEEALEMEYVIREDTATIVVYELSVYFADRTEQYMYVLQNLDGDWRFTQFPGAF